MALTPDGHWVLSGSKDRGVQFWNPRSGDTQLMLQGHKNSGTLRLRRDNWEKKRGREREKRAIAQCKGKKKKKEEREESRNLFALSTLHNFNSQKSLC